MKKLMFFICVLLAIVSVLQSCTSSDISPEELILELGGLFPEESGKSALYSSKAVDGFIKADGTDLGRLYMGKFEEPSCISRIESFAYRLPLDDSGFEIHVIKCINRSDTEELSALLMKRIDSVSSSEILDFAPESYEKYFRGAIIYTRKNYVFLLATPDNASVIKYIKKLI